MSTRTLSTRDVTQSVLKYALVILICAAFVAPFFYAISTSLKSQIQMMQQPRAFFPAPLHFENYIEVFNRYAVVRYFRNTLIVVGAVLVFNLLVSSFAGYALSRIQWKGREFLFLVTVSTMFMPLFLLLLPRFLIFKELGMLETLLPLIIAPALGSPTSIFLMRQYYRSIPMDLSEAAMIDGCTEFGIYWRIILPLTKPALATIAIFTVRWRWNDFIQPLIYLQSEKLYTVTMGLYTIMGTSAEEINIHHVMAFVIMSIAPMILIFLIAQRHFVEGSTHTGLKG
ncbi:MAG: carbohydrate ABC transporter permease [Spirochaetia bacterium]